MGGQPTRRGEQGFAFVAALLVTLVVSILVAGVLAMAVSARQLSTSRQEFTQALYGAESGINAVISEWRANGPSYPPAQPYTGQVSLADGSSAGKYNVTWTAPDSRGVVTLTSQGTVNPGLPGTIYNLTRTVKVDLDTRGNWAWDHVYCTDPNRSGYPDYPYAQITGNAGDITPSDPLDPHSPAALPWLPTPKWDQWEATAEAQDLVSGKLPYGACASGITADPKRHVYWFGKTAGEPVDAAAHLAGTSHTHRNGFNPDPYFPGLGYPSAYVCQPTGANSTFQVVFGKGQTYTGVYFVHGDAVVDNKVTANGTIVCTGSLDQAQGHATFDISSMIKNCPVAPHTIYPAIIAGESAHCKSQANYHTLGIIWAGQDYYGQAADESACIVAPKIHLQGNYSVHYGIDAYTKLKHSDLNLPCDYYPGASPPPMFNEPDRGQMQPTPRSWREIGL